MNYEYTKKLIREALARVSTDDRKVVAFSVAGCLWRAGVSLDDARAIMNAAFSEHEIVLVRRALWRAYGEPSGLGALVKLRLVELAAFFRDAQQA